MEKFIDCHFHIWDLQANDYPWLTDKANENVTKIIGDYTKIRKDYLIEDFCQDIGGLNVVAAVHLQADVNPADAVKESEWLQSVADTAGNGMPQGFVAGADLKAPNAAEVIAAHCAFSNMRGMRVEMHPGLNAAADFDPLKDETWLSNLRLLEKNNLVCEVRATSPEQSEGVLQLIHDHPNINFVFPHLGLSVWRDPGSIAAWKRNIKRYGKLPNATIKLSGYGLFGEHWTIDEVRPYVLDCIEAMGPDHLVCGSNYPVDSIAASYARIWETHSTLLNDAGCTAAEREKIFHDNAKRLYRL